MVCVCVCACCRCVVGYEGGSLRKPLVVLATGEGDIDELKANLADDAVAYGLYRAVRLKLAVMSLLLDKA